MKKRHITEDSDDEETYTKRNRPVEEDRSCLSYYTSRLRPVKENIDVKEPCMIPFLLPALLAEDMDITYLPRDENYDVYYTQRLFELYWKVYAMNKNLYHNDNSVIIDEYMGSIFDRETNSLVDFNDLLADLIGVADYSPFPLTEQIVNALCEEYGRLSAELDMLEEERLAAELDEMGL